MWFGWTAAQPCNVQQHSVQQEDEQLQYQQSSTPVHSGGSFLPFLDLLLSQHRNIWGLIPSMYAKADSSPDAAENKTVLISALAATVQKRILI